MSQEFTPYHRCRPDDNSACIRSSDFPISESAHDHLHGGICPSCAVEFPLSEWPNTRFTIDPRGLLLEIEQNPVVRPREGVVVVDIIQGIRRRRSIESEADLIRIHLYSFMLTSKMSQSTAYLRMISELCAGDFLVKEVQIVTTSEFEERHIRLESVIDFILNNPEINIRFVPLSQIIRCVSRNGDRI